MSSQNNMAEEIYPYKFIYSDYALSSSHKIFKSCTTLMTSQAIVSYFWCSQTFQSSHNTWAWAMDIALYVEYNGGCGEGKKEKIVSYQLGVSTGYGDAHQ